MRLPTNSLIAELRRSAEAAREAAAAERFNPETLRAAMVAAASAGFDHATVKGADGLDLRGTAAAKEAEAWLAAQKIEASWPHRDGAAGIEAESTYDLLLSWKLPVAK